MKLPMFITFEGIEGSGKSTQAKLLYNYLKSKNANVCLTHEPGGTPTAERIRNILLSKTDENFPKMAELFLYMASRAFNVENTIEPMLKDNVIVICDRFSDATLAYQGYGRGIDLNLIENLNELATDRIKPDITFLLDIPVKLGLKRLNGKMDRIESEKLDFHERVRMGYLEIAKANAERFVVLDGTLSKDEIFRRVRKRLNV